MEPVFMSSLLTKATDFPPDPPVCLVYVLRWQNLFCVCLLLSDQTKVKRSEGKRPFVRQVDFRLEAFQSLREQVENLPITTPADKD